MAKCEVDASGGLVINKEACIITKTKLDRYARVLFVNETITVVALMDPFHKESMLNNTRRQAALECFFKNSYRRDKWH